MSQDVQDFLGDVTVLQLCLWIALAVGVLVGLYKAWPWVKRAVKLVDALTALPAFMETVEGKVHELSDFMERVRHQVENDHDTNLRDEVTQILELSDATSTQVAELSDWQKNHELKSDDAYRRITALEQKEA
jgi:hypothetical protein